MNLNLTKSARIGAAALAIFTLSSVASSQTKGIFLVNETTGMIRSGWVLNWKLTAGGAFNTEDLFDYTVPLFGPGGKCIGTGDFNGDGFADAVWRVGGDSLVIMYQTSNQRGVGLVVDQTLDPGWTAISVGDFNGDEVPDILIQDPNKDVHVWIMGGPAGAQVQESIALGKTTKNGTDRFVGFTDVDGDGMADVIIQRTRRRLEFWKSTGTDVERDMSGKPTQYPLTTLRKKIGKYNMFHVIGTMDFDGDGHEDLVCRFTNGSRFTVWTLINDGSGNYPENLQNRFRAANFKTPLGVGGF
ncbi:MAG: FG-GAP repeat domain-containing protein [Fimbriimonadaceae bacterium]